MNKGGGRSWTPALAAARGVTGEDRENPELTDTRTVRMERTRTDTEPQDNTSMAPENGCFLLLPLHIPSYCFKGTNACVLAQLIH